jgi:hypothetical protein
MPLRRRGTGNDPGVIGKLAVVVRVFELGGAALQAVVEFTQRRHVGRIDSIADRLPAGAVTGQDKLHRAHRRDQRYDGEFDEATGFRHLRIADAQIVRF